MPNSVIAVRGASQNNLRDVDVDLPLGELIVVTGVSGSGKSSLAFDTIYSEGQRRYVETFSPYARQFLDRMDKPRVARIDGIPPAIAINQTNPVRTSRSTVGTMTELNDHLKLLFARVAELYCLQCGDRVVADDPESIYAALSERIRDSGSRITVMFNVSVPENFSIEEVERYLQRQGYTRLSRVTERLLEVTQDRFRWSDDNRARAIEAFENALKVGRGQLTVTVLDQRSASYPFSSSLHCPRCDRGYAEPIPNSFSFNSPMGACETCRGFGRTIGIDYDLVIPDHEKSLAEGAIKPFQTKTYLSHQREMLRYAAARGIDIDTPWSQLSAEDREFVIEGEGRRRQKKWYGLKRFFAWLERKSYRMHIRVLLAKYRSYELCSACGGSRLKPESLAWRIGDADVAAAVLRSGERFRWPECALSDERLAELPGLSFHDVMRLPLDRATELFSAIAATTGKDQPTRLVIDEISTRLKYLNDVGLAYLTLDRQSRTLSGGEVQRINLTTALGTSLVNTLFVLDEPSIGLHARDVARLIEVLQRLRDAGNTLLVVEHDAQVMLAADRIIDVGPGPGRDGGSIVFNGSPAKLLRSRSSKTAEYLSGRAVVAESSAALRRRIGKPYIEVKGACEHNLKDIDVAIPLGRLAAVTGVSGSGKSTLIQDTLYNGLAKLKGHPEEAVGRHREIAGAELVDDVVLVDQAPIGKTTRSNPASFVGVLEPIRKLFADEPLAIQRGYTAGTFSFNTGNGRCPTCSGNGFERIEMQFLSDVYLRCPECDGRRYRSEVLEVRYAPSERHDPKSIADILAMTVREALDYFSGNKDVITRLKPLAKVGLDYLGLGQSVPTLSGGEAQRLKLAAYLSKAANAKKGDGKGMLFLFDEPTTGLHFSDVAKLIGAFRELLSAGHSVLVVEHNLDVIGACDWIVDLGPEGGDEGGQIVAVGSPQVIAKSADSHTGAALAEHFRQLGKARASGAVGGKRVSRRARTSARRSIEIVHAREHNLQNVDVSIPRDKLTAITGVSGSGKSTVAFDILFAEGQRRYLESLNAYARQFVEPATRADVEAVRGIPPTVAIEQRVSRGGRKSTVATVTEIYHFLRLLFVKIGVQHCPDCRVPINAQTSAEIAAKITRRYRGRRISLMSPLIVGRKGYYTDLATWAAKKGYDALRVDGELVRTNPWPRLDRFKEHDIDLPIAEIDVDAGADALIGASLETALSHGRGMVRVVPVRRGKLLAERGELFSTERVCPSCHKSFEELDPRLFSYNSKYGWCPTCYGTGEDLADFDEETSGEEERWLEQDGESSSTCSACAGTRLRPEARSVYLKGRSIAEWTSLSVTRAHNSLSRLKLTDRELAIARDVLPEIVGRLEFLDIVGLGYLSLDRAAPTLSGGEAQRIRLAAQLGSNLRGVCYILDEPTIGLHARDNARLLEMLETLASRGNSVVVVEHDEEMIRRAEHIIDLGPGAGRLGGRVVATGAIGDLTAAQESVTGRVLAEPPSHPMFARRKPERGAAIDIRGATRNNLQNVSVSVPIGRLVCVSGVSGSGKSSLIDDVLLANLRSRVGRRSRSTTRSPWDGCEVIGGWQDVTRVLEVDQTPIGKTPRSCPATYVGIWDDIRKVYAATTEAKLRGYTAGRFSFNIAGGRCDICDGQGVKKVSMSFLPDVAVTCERCNGARFGSETLEVLFKGKSIADVLQMSVDEAADFFSAHPKVHHALKLLADVGLGYLSLGQPSPTLSGGEAQRVKLVTELAKVGVAAGKLDGAQHVLYVLDEPTIGLHIADVEKLLSVLHRLVDAGNSVIVIEHNLDVLAEADWIIDLGPEGGERGGRIVAQGPPEKLIARKRETPTIAALKAFMTERRRALSA